METVRRETRRRRVRIARRRDAPTDGPAGTSAGAGWSGVAVGLPKGLPKELPRELPRELPTALFGGTLRALLAAGTMAMASVSAVAAPSHHLATHAAAHATQHATQHASPGPTAHAAPAGGWSASSCGREPVAPTVLTDTVAHYNSSIDAVTAYDGAARSYNSCVSRTATAEQTGISAEAKRRIDAIQSVSEAVQKRIAANFTMLGAALKKGPPTH